MYLSARLQQFIAESNERALDCLTELLRKEQEKEQKERQKEYAALVKAKPIAEVLKTYVPPPQAYKRGGRQDWRGSFFLLAVTEHLHKRRRCYFLLAARLLKAIRGQNFAPGYQDRTNAKARAANLKNTLSVSGGLTLER